MNENSDSLSNDDKENHDLIRSFSEYLKTQAVLKCQEKLPTDEQYYELSTKLSKENSKLSYSDYKEFRDQAPKPLQKYMKTSTFLQSPKNELGQVFSNEILMCVQRSMDLERAYLGMMAQASSSDRIYLSEKELALFVHSLLPEIRNSRDMDEEFIPYFMITSARKFFFFHDLSNKGQISIKKLAHCSTMEELLFLRRLDQYEHDLEPKIYREQLGANWFYHKNTLYLFSLFTNLDTDQNGTLSVSEMMNFTGTSVEPAQFTRTACERIIQAHMKYGHTQGELDYIGFVNLVLAIENKTSMASLQYFWKVLDIFDTGRLTTQSIQYFYRDIYQILRRDDYPVAAASVITSEIFDILACNDPEGATFEMFKESGQGNIVASILLDASCFLIYENREAQINNQPNNTSEEVGTDS